MFVWFLSRFGDKEVLNNAKLESWSPSRCVHWDWRLAGTCPCCLLSCQGRPHVAAASLLGATFPWQHCPPSHSKAGVMTSTMPVALPERKSNTNMNTGTVFWGRGLCKRRRKLVLLIQKPHRRKLKVLGVSMEDMLKKQQLTHKRQQERKQEGKNCS